MYTNGQVGIFITGTASNISLSDNRLTNDSIHVRYDSPVATNHNVDISNTVNGKPVYCFVNEHNKVVPPGAGQIILLNCHSVTVRDQTISDTDIAVSIQGSTDISIINNTISSTGDLGLYLVEVVGGTISDNKIYNSNSGIFIDWHCTDNEFRRNTIFNNTIGVQTAYYTDESNRFYGNDLYNNTEYAVNTTGRGYILDARENWWGDDSGPYHPSDNPDGKGDSVSVDVIFDDWLEEPVGSEERDPQSGGEGPGEEESGEFQEDEAMDQGIFLATVVAILLALGFALFLGVDALSYPLLEAALPRYTRLNEDRIDQDIRQQNIRGQIYLFIQNNPGASFSAVRRQLGIGTGTAVYHLSVLRREGYLRSGARGRRRLFWEKNDFPGFKQASLTGIQQNILYVLSAGEEMSRVELQKRTAIADTTLRDNLKILEEAGLLRQEKREGKAFCSLVEEPGLILA